MANTAAHMTLSLDGFGTGKNQSLETPFGDEGALDLHRWMVEEAAFDQAENDVVTRYGAFIMGRNMFSPGRGDWDPNWTGWWGSNPPYHAPVYVLTHHARAPLEMEGGTIFHFVTDGPRAALARARDAAGDEDVAIAGGVTTLRDYLNAGLVKTLHIRLAPVLVFRGENLWDGLDARLEPISARTIRLATHLDFKVHPSD